MAPREIITEGPGNSWRYARILAERAGFDALGTLDRGIMKKQNLAWRRISLILHRVRSSRLSEITPLVPALIELLAKIQPGDVEIIRAEETA